MRVYTGATGSEESGREAIRGYIRCGNKRVGLRTCSKRVLGYTRHETSTRVPRNGKRWRKQREAISFLAGWVYMYGRRGMATIKHIHTSLILAKIAATYTYTSWDPHQGTYSRPTHRRSRGQGWLYTVRGESTGDQLWKYIFFKGF